VDIYNYFDMGMVSIGVMDAIFIGGVDHTFQRDGVSVYGWFCDGSMMVLSPDHLDTFIWVELPKGTQGNPKKSQNPIGCIVLLGYTSQQRCNAAKRVNFISNWKETSHRIDLPKRQLANDSQSEEHCRVQVRLPSSAMQQAMQQRPHR
jgi:hypothetical protein